MLVCFYETLYQCFELTANFVSLTCVFEFFILNWELGESHVRSCEDLENASVVVKWKNPTAKKKRDKAKHLLFKGVAIQHVKIYNFLSRGVKRQYVKIVCYFEI